MKDYLIDTCTHPNYGGLCMLFKFPNNYGASVIRHSASKGGPAGLFELAPLQFRDEETAVIVLDTHIIDETVGCLFWEEVLDLLSDIKNLS